MMNSRQLVLASGAFIYLSGLVLLTHAPLSSTLVDAKEDHWSEDKIIHLIAYASLAAIVTAIPMVRIREEERAADDRDMTLVGVIAASLTLIAALDEFTQPYFGRSMTIFDWFADVVGIAIGQGFAITLCMTMIKSSDFASNGESANLVTSFIGEDEPDRSYAALQSGASWLHLAAVAYSAEVHAASESDDESGSGHHEWSYEGGQNVEVDIEVADGEGTIGHRRDDCSSVDAGGVDSSSALESQSSAVGRGAPGSGGQLLPSGSGSESVSDAGRVERDLLVWDDARR